MLWLAKLKSLINAGQIWTMVIRAATADEAHAIINAKQFVADSHYRYEGKVFAYIGTEWHPRDAYTLEPLSPDGEKGIIAAEGNDG